MSSALNRIFQIDALVRSGAYPNAKDLSARFEVSLRTIYGDIDYFKSTLQAPIHYSRRHNGYYYTDTTWSLPSVIATEGELLAFFLSVELTRRYLGTAFEAPLRKIVDQLASWLPDKLRIDLSALAEHYTFQPGATVGADPALLVALFECVRESWPLDVTYFTASSGERKQRIIEPYHLFNVRGDWQVVAFDHFRHATRQFAVSRIEAWKVLRDQRFVRDPTFSAVEYLSTGFLAERGDQAVAIEVWFDAYQARYMRGREFHPSQQVKQHTDGAGMMNTLMSGSLA
ncbi:MAG: WYL domain-containing protein, partial [Chloroflexales bacterium]|nr:WYL domain-containing protein [Chloroflexales bacterium]